YQEIALSRGSEVVLIRQDGELLARDPQGAADEPGHPFIDAPLYLGVISPQHEPGKLLKSRFDGRERIYAGGAVHGYPLAIGVSVERSALLESWQEQVLHSTVRTTLLCLSIVALVLLVVRHLRRSERAEAQLRVQTALLDELFESAPEAIVMLDLDQRVTRVNREFTRMFGYSGEQIRGQALDALIVPSELQ